MKCLLLIAHGSRRAASNQEVCELAERIQAQAGNRFDLVQGAFLKLDGIGKKTENFQYDTDSLKKNLSVLSIKAKEQQAYIKNTQSLNKNR